MSVAKIDLLEACSERDKEALGQALIDTISRTILVPRERIRIIIHDRTEHPEEGGSYTFIKWEL
ncbi:tautomerase family protein [Marinobacterium arenosum]|uniref:tautomerase family protein n=1 Tax=Marinobacterium arenosum TaxID=2862496 RepID=UPI001C94E574|nr:tautomerase family protein [Marinobacterium arenosum]MBY4678750.1 tautomerase family protein [Marinobacterium arenosum]